MYNPYSTSNNITPPPIDSSINIRTNNKQSLMWIGALIGSSFLLNKGIGLDSIVQPFEGLYYAITNTINKNPFESKISTENRLYIPQHQGTYRNTIGGDTYVQVNNNPLHNIPLQDGYALTSKRESFRQSEGANLNALYTGIGFGLGGYGIETIRGSRGSRRLRNTGIMAGIGVIGSNIITSFQNKDSLDLPDENTLLGGGIALTTGWLGRALGIHMEGQLLPKNQPRSLIDKIVNPHLFTKTMSIDAVTPRGYSVGVNTDTYDYVIGSSPFGIGKKKWGRNWAASISSAIMGGITMGTSSLITGGESQDVITSTVIGAMGGSFIGGYLLSYEELFTKMRSPAVASIIGVLGGLSLAHSILGSKEPKDIKNKIKIPDPYSPLYNVIKPEDIESSIKDVGIRKQGLTTPWLTYDPFSLDFKGINLTDKEYKQLNTQGPLERIRKFDSNVLVNNPYDDKRQFVRINSYIPQSTKDSKTIDYVNPLFVGYQTLFLTSTVGLLTLGSLDEKAEYLQKAIEAHPNISDARRLSLLNRQGIAGIAQPFAHGFNLGSKRALSYLGLMTGIGTVIGTDLGIQNNQTVEGTTLGALSGLTLGLGIPALVKGIGGENAIKKWRPFSFAQGLDDLKQKEQIWKAQRDLTNVGGSLLQDISDTSLKTKGFLSLGIGFGLGSALATGMTGDPVTGTLLGGTTGLLTGAYLASMHKRRVNNFRTALSTAGIDIASTSGKVIPSLFSYAKNEFINTLKGLTLSLYPLSRVVYNITETQHERDDDIRGKEFIDPLDPTLKELDNTNNPLQNDYFHTPIQLLESTSSSQRVKEQRDLVRYIKTGARYGSEFVSTNDPGTIQLYDHQRLGEGFIEFLKNVDAGSAKGAFYSVSADEEVMRLMSRAAQKEGIITSYAQLKLNPFYDPFSGELIGDQSKGEIFNYFGGYVGNVLKKEGLGAAANAFFTSNLYSWVNSASSIMGFGPLIKYEDQVGSKGIYLDRGVAAVEGAINQATKSLPTYFTTLGVSAEPPIVSLYKRLLDPNRKALLAQDPTSFSTGGVNPTVGGLIGGGLGLGVGMLLGKDLGGRAKGGITGAILGTVIGASLGVSSFMRMLPGMTNLGDREIFHPKFGGQSEYIIHSKMILGSIRGEKVAFVSTGNIGAMYKAYKGEPDQMNYGLFISDKSKYGSEIIHDLEVAYDAIKTASPGEDLDLSKMLGHSVVVGGPVKGIERDSKTEWRNFIKKATRDKQDILWTSAYSQGAETNDLLFQHLDQGNNVTIVMQNPFGVKGGGFRQGTQNMLITLLQKSIELKQQKERGLNVGELKVIINPSFSEVLQHSKMMIAGDDIWLGSHNFSNNSFNKVFEIALKLHNQKGLARALESSVLADVGNYGFTDITDLFARVTQEGKSLSEFEKMLASKDFNDSLEDASKLTAFSELNISGEFFPMFKETEQGGTLLINPKMGTSYFHSRNLYNNLQRQGRAYHRIINEQDAGIASSLYKIAYIAKINERAKKDGIFNPVYSNLKGIPGIVQAYDKELYTQGLGGILNEKIFMPLGFGRLYKDELGFLPSLMGGIGQVLDRTYLFYSGNQNIQGLTTPYADINASSNKYKERAQSQGLFETLLGQGTFLVQSSAQALVFYMTIGEPLNLILSESFKSSTEALIHDSISGSYKDFNKVINKVKRQYLLGQGFNSSNPIGTKLSLIDTIQRMNHINTSFYSQSNFSPTIYHMNSLFMRTRSASLLEDVMKPFLLSVFNPYTKSHIESQEGFIKVIDAFIQHVGSPIELAPIYNASQEGRVKSYIDKRNNILHHISQLISGNNTPRVNDVVNRVDDAIGYKHSRQLMVDNVKNFINTHGLNVVSNSNVGTIDELEDLIAGTSRAVSNNTTLKDTFYQLIIDPSTSPNSINNAEERAGRVYDFGLSDEGVLINSINFKITNEGIDRASIIALRLQGILDEIPLNPFYWGLFNKYEGIRKITGERQQGYKRVVLNNGVIVPKVRTIGDVLSFSELTERIRDITFGKGGISEHFIKARVQSQYDWLQEIQDINASSSSNLSTEEQLNILNSNIKSSVKSITDKLHTFWNATIGFGLEAGKRAIDKYKLIMGTPFGIGGRGIIKSSIALKNFEYHLLTLFPHTDNPALRGIQWGDDPENLSNAIKSAEVKAREIWANRGTISPQEFISSYGLFTNEDDFINNYVSRYLYKHAEDIDPLTRQINAIDEYAIKQLRVVHDVQDYLAQRAIGARTGTQPLSNVMDGNLWIEAHERLRAETMGLFRMGLINEKELQRRLVKLNHGWGGDATGKITKNKGITTALSLMSIFSIFGDQFMRNTSGVSLFTQLGYSLFMGGGPVGHLLGNDQGELKVNTQFDADRVLPDLPFIGRTGTIIATNLALLGAASVIGTSTLRSEAVSYGFLLEKLIAKIKIQKNNGLPYGIDLQYVTDEIGPTAPGVTPGKVTKLLSDHIALNSMTASQLKTELNAAQNLRLVFNVGNESFGFASQLQGNQISFRALRTGGNLWFNTAISYLALSVGASALTKGVSSMMNYMRDSTSTLDPMAYALLGSIALGASTKKFGMGLVGLLGGAGLGFLSNKLGINLLSIGSKGSLTDNVQGTIVSQLSAFRHQIRKDLKNASRAELMAAILGEGIENKFSVLDSQQPAKETKVIARQVTFPLVQFFSTTKVVGERVNATGKVVKEGDRYFYLGIQGPPITGMSMSLSLPFKILKSQPTSILGEKETRGAVLGLAINEEADLLDYLYQVSMITSSFALLGRSFKGLGRLTNTITRGSLETNPFYSMGKGLQGIGKLVEDISLLLPSSITKAGIYLSTANLQNIQDVIVAKRKYEASGHIPDWESKLGRNKRLPLLLAQAAGVYMIGSNVSRIAYGITAPSSKDIEINSDKVTITSGVILSSLFLGYGLLKSNTNITNTSNIRTPQSNFSKAIDLINGPKLATLRKYGFSVGLFTTAAMIMTNSNFGLFQGMDSSYAKEREDYLDSHQLLVSLGYGILMGSIATSIGGMGSSSADVIRDYKKVLDNPNASVAKRIFSMGRTNRLSEEAEQIYEYIRNKGSFIERQYKLVDAIDPNNSHLTREFHLWKIREMFVDQGFTSMKQALTSSSADDLLIHIQGAKGAYIDKALASDRIFRRMLKGPVGFVTGATLIGSVLSVVNPKLFNTNNFYSWIQGEGVYADGKEKGLGIRNVIADIARLMTFTDRSIDSRINLDRVFRSGQTYGGKTFMVTNEKLLLSKKGFGQELNNSIQALSELLVLDDVNTFLSGPGGFGITLRRGETGTVLTPYFQLQASGTDISAAAYSMASRFLFKSMSQSTNELSFEIQNAMKGIDAYLQAGLEPPRSKVRKAALGLLLSTASLQPREKPRRTSRADGGINAALSNASLTMSLDARNSLSRNLAYQPIESLVSRLYLDTMTLSHRSLDNLMRNRISPLGSAQEGIGTGKDLSSYLFGDPFYITSRKLNITNIKFFVSDPSVKRGQRVKGTKGGQGDVYNEYSNLHLDTYIGEDTDLLFSPLIQKLNAVINTLPQPLPLLIYGGLLIGIPLYVLPLFLGEKKVQAEMTEQGIEAIKLSSERWFTTVDPKDTDQVKAAWGFRSSYPLPGQSRRVISGGENVPIMYKGNYQVQLNKILGMHAGISRAFVKELGQLQYLLDENRIRLDIADPDRILHLNELLNSDEIVNQLKKIIHGSIERPTNLTSLYPTDLDPNRIAHLTGNQNTYAKKLIEDLGIPSSANITGSRVAWRTTTGENVAVDIRTLTANNFEIDINYESGGTYLNKGTISTDFGRTNNIRDLLNNFPDVSLPKPLVSELVTLSTTHISSAYRFDPNKSIKENLFMARKAEKGIKAVGSGFPPQASQEIDAVITTLERLYSSHITSNTYVSEVVDKLTGVYMKHTERLIDKYVDTLINSHIDVDINTAKSLYKSLGFSTDDIDTLINTRFRNGVTSIKVKTVAMFIPGLDINTLLSIENEADLYKAIEGLDDIEYKQRMAIDSDGTIDMRKSLKSTAKASVKEYLEEIISQLNLNPKDFAEVLGSGELGDPNFQVKMITHKLMLALNGGKVPGEEGFFSIMRHHWGGLTLQPQEGVKRTLINALKGLINRAKGQKSNYMTVGEDSANQIISSVNKPKRILPSTSPIGNTESEDTRRFLEALVNHNTNRTSGLAKYSKGVFQLLGYLGFAADTLEALNIFGAFAYLGNVYNSSNATQADKRLAARSVGNSLTAYTVGITLNLLTMGVMSVGSSLVATFGLPLVIAGGLGVAIAGGIGLLSMSKDTKKGIKKTWDKLWQGTTEFWSDTTYNLAEGLAKDNTSNRVVAAMLGGAGGGLAGLGIGLGVIGFMTSLTLLTGVAIVGATALTLGGIGAALGFISPKGIGDLSQGLLKGLNNFRIGGVPIFNLFITTADEAQQQFLQGISAPVSGTSQSSPFFIGTVNDAIALDYKRFLYSAKDLSGKDAASQFISPTVYGRAPVATNSVVNRYGDFMTIRPDGLIDPSIQRELNIRGQMFNQSIIGSYTWRVMLINSTNINAIRKAQQATLTGMYLNKSYNQIITIKNQSGTIAPLSYTTLNTPSVKIDNYSSGATDLANVIIEHIERAKIAIFKTKQPLNVELHKEQLNNNTVQGREVSAIYNMTDYPVHYQTSIIESHKGSQVVLGFNESSDTIASINQLPYSS